MIEVSVVVGSFKQREKLREVLISFEEQTFPKNRFEVIIVDSSSFDGTKEMVLSQNVSYKIDFMEVENKGKSHARNQGIKGASGKIIILTDADMIAEKNFIKTHWQAQNLYEFKVGFEGLTYNLKEIKKPFKEAPKEPYIKQKLKQYQKIGWYYFLGGNLSLPTEVLKSNLFSCDFLGYGWEDLELGYRLFKKEISLHYLPSAVNYHFHFWTFEEKLKRKEKMGLEAHVFIRKHPELKTWLGFHPLLMFLYYLLKKQRKLRSILEKYCLSDEGRALAKSTQLNKDSLINNLAKYILEEYYYRRGYDLGNLRLKKGEIPDQDTKYDVSVIIVTYNQKKLLKKCLDSFFRYNEVESQLRIEVLVVDNHSTDETIFMVKEKFPQIRYIFLDKNYGFAKSVNLGIKESSGKNIFLLNNDTLFNSNILKELYDYMKKNKEVSACGPKLLNEKRRFQNQGSVFLSIKLRFAKVPISVDFLPMTALLVKRKVFFNIGLLDEYFFFYNEDLDFAKRMKKAGYIIHYLPNSSLVHIGKKSAAIASDGIIYESYKGGVYFVKKHYPKWVYFIFIILVLVETSLKISYFSLKKNGKEKVKALKKVQNFVFK